MFEHHPSVLQARLKLRIFRRTMLDRLCCCIQLLLVPKHSTSTNQWPAHIWLTGSSGAAEDFYWTVITSRAGSPQQGDRLNVDISWRSDRCLEWNETLGQQTAEALVTSCHDVAKAVSVCVAEPDSNSVNDSQIPTDISVVFVFAISTCLQAKVAVKVKHYFRFFYHK